MRFFLMVFACFFLAVPSIGIGQDYPNSVASTDFDYIIDSDPSTFEALRFVGILNAEMPDKRPGNHELRHPAFVFVASFSDGTSVQISVDSAFEARDAAEKEAMRYIHRLGKLPTTLRMGVDRLVVHQGGRDTTAFSDNGLIVVYSENATKRISTHDLEETIFHESVHASWDKRHAGSVAWKKAQSQDGNFVTLYAKRKPEGEDLAESALFAYTLVHHPGRIPTADAAKIKKAIPARIRFVAELIPPNKPIFFPVVQQKKHDMSGDAGQADSEPNVRKAAKKTAQKCNINLSLAGQLNDIISNALMQGLDKKEADVRNFLDSQKARSASSEELFSLTLSEFKLQEAELIAKVLEYLHCNCDHHHDPAAAKNAEELLKHWALRKGTKLKKS